MPETTDLTFDAAVARLTSWVGGTVEAWVEFADGPSHVAGMHGELGEVEDQTVDARSQQSRTFSVGESAWFRLVRSYENDSERLRPVEFVAHPPELMFDWEDGTLHIVRSSSSSPL